MKRKGWIALDIDGTLTHSKHQIDVEVLEYIKSLSQSGWEIVFLTGRTFSFANPMLSQVDFPYYFAVQNGTDILQMPKQKRIFHSYLDANIFSYLKSHVDSMDAIEIVYLGYEKKDVCFWKTNNGVSSSMQEYIKDLGNREKHHLKHVSFFDPDLRKFALIKYVGTFEVMTRLAQRLKKDDVYQISLIQDPFNPKMYLLMITNKMASKGKALQELTKHKKESQKVIAAGNDDNDLSMLEVADIKIAMDNSPKHLLQKAHYVAPPVEKHGIVLTLKQILSQLN